MDVRAQRQERANLSHFIARLALDDAAEHEIAAIHSIWRSAETHRMGASIPRVPGGVRVITNGWVGWARTLAGGRRVIFLFLTPGDLIPPGIGQVGNCDLACLTSVRTMDAQPILDYAAPKATAAILGCGLAHRMRLVDHMTRLTIGCTESSLAHLLLELHDRLRTSDGERFSLPIGQRVIAQSLGRSTVQINKSFRGLRDRGLIEYDHNWAQVLNRSEMQALGGLDPVLEPQSG